MRGFGSVLARELSSGKKLKRPKYSVRNERAVILQQCPHCKGFNLLERTGQAQTTEDDKGIGYVITSRRWFTCGDCNVPVDLEDTIKRNRKDLDSTENKLLLEAAIKQDSKVKVYEIIKRNNHALNPVSNILVELYDKYYPTDPISTMEYEENA